MPTIPRSNGQSGKRQLDRLIDDHGDSGFAGLSRWSLRFDCHELDDRAKSVRSRTRRRGAAPETTPVRGVHQGRIEFRDRLVEQLVGSAGEVRETLFGLELRQTCLVTDGA